MFRSSFSLLKHGVSPAAVVRSSKPARPFGWRTTGCYVESSSNSSSSNRLCACLFSSSIGDGGGLGLGFGDGGGGNGGGYDGITYAEAKKLMRLVNVEELKVRLSTEGKETIRYSELLEVCESMGVARSNKEAEEFVRVLDEAGVVIVFRDKVYLHPDKVVDLVKSAVPLALTPEDDPSREELRVLQAKQEEIDVLAHKQVRRILWTGLGLGLAQISLFFRLTFWEFSWDVMEPVAFFTTTSGLIIGYAYFLFTSRDPTYQDLMKRLFLSRQRKLVKKHNFDMNRFLELQKKCKSPFSSTGSRVGLET
ncbi:hypothetical protein OSB04_001143 [Centaurea solstitialis]|uniref:Calcium uniporter protein C-terminal domain-containing protein n=1 Tax=Centaurea solstitialis TaxID=347529 RepID=A0AA38WLG1_9ASTR|nr:hypothetical protein OSB04_001143 [Centaurea solstitialis]